MRLSREVLNVLDSGKVDGKAFFITAGQLDRALYTAVNKALECLGGKWDRKVKGHVFSTDVADIIDDAILAGEVVDKKKEFDFFQTPAAVVKSMLEAVSVVPGARILEPSAGSGAIADLLCSTFNISQSSVDCCELNPECADILKNKGYALVGSDFLQYLPEQKYDVICMNPPFSKQQDIKHVTHAYSMLKDGGTLVAIMSEGTFFRQNSLTNEFRKLCAGSALSHNESLPAGTFKESGTMVATRMLVLKK